STDATTLLRLKTSLEDPSAALNSWSSKTTSVLCQWNGVTCSPDGLVIRLDLRFKSLSGAIPFDVIGDLSHLQGLFLSGNNLTISPISSCKSLEALDISHNLLSGDVEQVINLCARNLKTLNASHNSFTGDLPASLPSKLRILNLSSNRFTNGDVMRDICSSTGSELEELIISNNRLTGPFLHTILLCRKLKVLDLSFNTISGEIPTDLCEKTSKLEHFAVWSNELHGPVPTTISKCSSLVTLILSFNNLQGPIPPEVSKLHSLEWLILSSNNLSGTIPSSLGQLKRLTVLAVSNNSLEGELPGELSGCEKLAWLDLNNNRLTGEIPPRIGRSKPAPLVDNTTREFRLVFDNNEAYKCPGNRGINSIFPLLGISIQEFQTKAPMVCNKRLYIYQDKLFPEIDSLVLVDLSGNLFTGAIPVEFGDMQSLYQISLARNRMSGRIPSSLGFLKRLSTVDLSSNLFTGVIPVSFSRLPLMDFNVSFNNLSGGIPQKGQLTTFPLSSFQGNSGLC
ncbi:hypothetical protein SELMODRAFT_31808, partial [Selaginella moellendorffii]